MNTLSHVTLPNLVKISSIGYGTWKLFAGDETEAAIKNALGAGYRHIDTAAPERMKENISVFNFELSPEDMACIDALPNFAGSGLDPDNFETSQQGGG